MKRMPRHNPMFGYLELVQGQLAPKSLSTFLPWWYIHQE